MVIGQMANERLHKSPPKKRCILILLDGLGDRSYSCLGNKTPLQAAHTPILDRLAAQGANGLFLADQYGMALPSELAHFAFFGYDQKLFPGRGLLEATGANVPISDDEVAILAHFVCLEEHNKMLILSKRRPVASEEEAGAFVKAVQGEEIEDISFSFIQTKGLGGILKLRGPVSSMVSDSDCIFEGEPLSEIFARSDAGKDTPFAKNTAKALNAYLSWCYRILCRHPLNVDRTLRGESSINGIVTQRAGQRKIVPPFFEQWGLRAVSVSSGLMYWGLSQFLGIDVHKVEDSDDPGEDLRSRLQWAIRQGQAYEFIHVHSKAPDVAAHTKNPHNKVKTIESLDRGLGKIINDLLNDETVLVVTGDHSTPSGGPLIHSGEPVPIVVTGPGIRRDRVSSFDEVCCAEGALGQVRHRDFMLCVLNWLDRAKLQGLMDSSEDHPYWPGKRKPFYLL